MCVTTPFMVLKDKKVSKLKVRVLMKMAGISCQQKQGSKALIGERSGLSWFSVSINI